MNDILSPFRGRNWRDGSPQSALDSSVYPSPVAARRSSLEERRRPAAVFESSKVRPEHSHHSGEHDANDIKPINTRSGGSSETNDHVLAENADDPANNVEPNGDGDDGDNNLEGDGHDDEEGEGEEDGEEEEDDDDHSETSPLLPIFSAEQLDSLPVYNITHTIRLLVIPRCETTLTWDQLRSPQVSQFLVKPIELQIRTSHFSKATLYALMANCLQFSKEVHTNPGNSGVSRTRATICELLAIRLLKDFSTRELVYALSYDFLPLQGLPSNSGVITPGPNWDQKHRVQPRVARISALEVAIRAQAKRFLAHPLVVQQLEAIWAGSIVFHAAADNLHRAPIKITPNQNRGYGMTPDGARILQASPNVLQPAKQRDHAEPQAFVFRRSVTLYDPKQASLFKLSRLRVPRYRQVLSTCSFAALLLLYVAVLSQRSVDITLLEVIFWFWSAGFMLDEVVGFNEQGFSLYIMSFWNTFDLGILILLMFYYGLRISGVLMSSDRKHQISHMAYDLLAANAVLLFPRLFSVLDHYRYFSQLLIAFRMMAMDLVAVFVLIVISCSGFFVAFTLSFGSDNHDAGAVAYALFQMLMGFTPAAWENWALYNPLGKSILVLFLFICHFLIVTILITVLTNSFMAIVQNANEEHQFVFAVNTISMVKSDALFSYVAPTNILAWALAPLRFLLPFRQFIRINRTVIKATHFPVLFIIYAYERLILHRTSFEPTDLVEQRGRSRKGISAMELAGVKPGLISPKATRLREPSIATYQKDRALEEVFRRPFRDNTIRGSTQTKAQRETTNVVKSWMQNLGPNGTASPPVEQDRSIVDRLEARRLSQQHSRPSIRPRRDRPSILGREMTAMTMSVVSDPEDFVATASNRLNPTPSRDASQVKSYSAKPSQIQTDGEGDDGGATNDEEDRMTLDSILLPIDGSIKAQGTSRRKPMPSVQEDDYFQQSSMHPSPAQPNPIKASVGKKIISARVGASTSKKSRHHIRIPSTGTILYDPPNAQDESNSSVASPTRDLLTTRNSARNTGTVTPIATPLPLSAGRRTPKRRNGAQTPANIPKTPSRPLMPARSAFQSAPNLYGLLSRQDRRGRRSSMVLDLASDLGDNKAIGGSALVGAVPASFATQMGFAAQGMQIRQQEMYSGLQGPLGFAPRGIRLNAAKRSQALMGNGRNNGHDDNDEDDDDDDDDDDDNNTFEASRAADNRMSKLMLARMNTLEQSFGEVLREVKELRRLGRQETVQ